MHDLIDIGANLTHDSFDKDRDEVIHRAVAAGVRRQIVTGTSVDDSRKGVELAGRHPGMLFATAGVHPHHAHELDDIGLTELGQFLHEEPVVAVGECGLDYFRNFSPRDAQLDAFEKQLNLAVQVQKPVFLHQRDAHQDFIAMLKNSFDKIPGGVSHCFTGNRDEMRACLDMGLHIGITGWICDERRGHDLQEAARYLPLDRIMLETDAPYLLPRDLKDKPDGRRNEPSVLPHILETIARYMALPAKRIAEAATRNTETLFHLATTVDQAS